MRRFLVALVVFGFSAASCTAILGGVPTSGGSGGAGGAGGSSTSGHGGSTSTHTATASAGVGGGSGGTTDTSSTGGAGGGGQCFPKDAACQPGTGGDKCCAGLTCVDGRCSPSTQMGSSSASGGGCVSCDAVLQMGQPVSSLCQSSGVIWENLLSCVCNLCISVCMMECQSQSMGSPECSNCALANCQQQLNACVQDTGN